MDIMREENGVMSEKSNNLIKRERLLLVISYKFLFSSIENIFANLII